MVSCCTPKRQQRVRHRRACAAGAELHHAAQRGTRHAAPESSAKPHQSVFSPRRLPSCSTTVLTAPSAFGVRRQFIEQRDDRLLAGMRDVQPGKAHALGRQQQLRQRLDAEPERSRSIIL